MSLDDLVTLLLLLLFIGAPLVGRLRGRSRRSRGGRGRANVPERRGSRPEERTGERSSERPAARPAERPAERPTGGPAGGPVPGPEGRAGGRPSTAGVPAGVPGGGRADAGGDSELERRLADARRRVREALGESGDEAAREAGAREAGAPGRASSTGPAAGSPTAGPFPDPGQFPGRQAAEAARQRRLPAPFLGREGQPGDEGVVPGRRRAPPPVTPMQPPARPRAARLPGGRVPVSPSDIVQGIVWHQILSEPVAKRPRRRRPSPPR